MKASRWFVLGAIAALVAGLMGCSAGQSNLTGDEGDNGNNEADLAQVAPLQVAIGVGTASTAAVRSFGNSEFAAVWLSVAKVTVVAPGLEEDDDGDDEGDDNGDEEGDDEGDEEPGEGDGAEVAARQIEDPDEAVSDDGDGDEGDDDTVSTGTGPAGGFMVVAEFNPPLLVNLMELDIEGQVLGEADVPVGDYQQIRLVLAPNDDMENPANWVELVGDDTKYPLKTPSGQESGLKINGGFTVAGDTRNAILIEFDPNDSIIERGNSPQAERFLLQPTAIRIIQGEPLDDDESNGNGDADGDDVGDDEGDDAEDGDNGDGDSGEDGGQGDSDSGALV